MSEINFSNAFDPCCTGGFSGTVNPSIYCVYLPDASRDESNIPRPIPQAELPGLLNELSLFLGYGVSFDANVLNQTTEVWDAYFTFYATNGLDFTGDEYAGLFITEGACSVPGRVPMETEDDEEMVTESGETIFTES